jgi:RHS repeat-associated protein
MGELIENVHTFVVPGGDPYTFKMEWNYDSWNRINTITYPDGEVVSYSYNDAGALHSLSGVKNSQSFNYVDTIAYDKFGSRVRVRYGNNTVTKYSYDAQSRRLSNLKSYDGSGNVMQDIDYYYHNNGNIAAALNSANSIGTMGGAESYYHYYDSLSRLVGSLGSFTDYNNNSYTYNLNMQYSASGNITQKSLTGTTLLNGVSGSVSYTNNYNYTSGSQPHAVKNIKNTSNVTTHTMSWDANGNMTQLNIPAQGLYRNMCWDEENRLTVVKDPEQFSHYIYNAGGERVWKLTGGIERMTINGRDYFDMAMLDKTLYTSPYMILTEREYTKHYYIESQRVTTKIGAGMDSNPVNPITGTLEPIGEYSVSKIADDLLDNLSRISCTEGLTFEIGKQFEYMEELTQIDNDETQLYFYHGDHLGSSSWITNLSGNATQHLAYMAFGEDFINERSSNDIRFKFTGKERDSETGMDYFGARYYEKDMSIWLSVDPLASKYPSMSPFMYCAGNPVILVDPDGKKIEYAGIKEYLHVLRSRISSKEFRREFKILKNDKHTYKYKSYKWGELQDKDGASGQIELMSSETNSDGDQINSFEIQYELSDRHYGDGVGRSKLHGLFEETFHAADYAADRSTSQLTSADSKGRVFLGHQRGDMNHEARAWNFAANYAPNPPKMVKENIDGYKVWVINPLVQQIRELDSDPYNPDPIISKLLYEGYSTRLFITPGDVYRTQTRKPIY